MIYFINEKLREEFHSLPVGSQIILQDMAEKFEQKKLAIHLIGLEKWGNKDDDLEVNIRINKEFVS
jgi:hypothetical protein